MITVKQVLNKVRELAHTRPEHIYRKASMSDQCSYVGPGVASPMEPDAGCIMGQAMTACGVSAETLHDIESFKGAMSFGEIIPNYGDRLEVKTFHENRSGPRQNELLQFGDKVQSFQDEGRPWGEAYKEAVIHYVAKRHEYQESDLIVGPCGKCALKRESIRHQGAIQVGDIVEHAVRKDLDPRTVVRVWQGSAIWLDVPGSKPIGPFPPENYRVIDIDWDVAGDG